MEILRTIIRFLIIAIAIGILVFLSITLFKLIPKGINQLANATVNVTDRDRMATTTATSTNTAVVVVPPQSDVYTTQGGIIITEKTPSKPAPIVAPTAKTPTKVVQQAPARTYYPNPVSQPSGRKNLRVNLISMGMIGSNGVYTQASSFGTQDTVSVKFLVVNDQDTATGPWSLRMDMPTIDAEDRVKILNNLTSIPAGSSFTLEARFSGIDLSRGVPTVTVNLDPYNQVAETSESDNTLTVQVPNVRQDYYYDGPYTNGYYDNGYYYNQNNNCSYTNMYGGYYNCDYYNNNNYNNGSYNSGSQPNVYVTSFETGRIVNGIFYAQSNLNYGERLAIRARIRNNGGYFSNSWSSKITVVDPYGYSREYIPGASSGLSSGSETVITYEIDNLNRGSNRVTFMADSQYGVYESNESDNTYQVYVQVN